jgi:rubrerythrin
MATRFNADEILEMAGRIETNGARFYRKAARLHVAARDLLNEIAQEEDRHYQTFMEMRRNLTPSEKGAGVDLTGEVEMYLGAMVDGADMDINRDPSEVLTGREPLKDIFRMAIGLEKDSIAFYLGLKDVVPPALGKDKLDAIVREEMRHIAWLHDKRKALGA